MPPWEKYQSPASGKPWEKYAAAQPEPKEPNLAQRTIGGAMKAIGGGIASANEALANNPDPRAKLLSIINPLNLVEDSPEARAVRQGVTLGFSDEIAGALGGQKAGQDARQKANQFRKDRPVTATALEVAGGALPAVATGGRSAGTTLAGTVGRSAATGAAYGGAYGFGTAEGNALERLPQAATTAAVGATLGAAAPVISKAASELAVKPIGRLLVRVFPSGGKVRTETARKEAAQKILQAFNDDGVTLDDAVKKIDDWAKGGAKPETLMELGGENVKALAASISNVPGPAKQTALTFFKGRQAGQNDRVMQDIAKAAGVDASKFLDDVDQLVASQKAASDPLYARARLNDPLKIVQPGPRQQRAAADLTAKANGMRETAAELQSRVATLKRQESAAKANFELQTGLKTAGAGGQTTASRASFNDAMRSRLRDERRAKELLSEADIAEAKARNMLNPRASRELLQLIESRPALKRAVSIARTKVQNRGNKTVKGDVPTMEVLDRAKGVLDDEIGGYMRAGANRDAGDIIALKNEFVKLLDDANPEYAKARAAFAGPAEVKNAIEAGRDAGVKTPPDQIMRQLSEMTPSEQDGFKRGFVRALYEKFGNQRTGLDRSKVFDTPFMEERIRAVFGQDADAFLANMAREGEMFQSAAVASPRAGSQTARLSAGIVDADTLGDAVSIAGNAAAQRPVSAIAALLRAGKRIEARAMLPETREELSKIMFSTDTPFIVRNLAKEKMRLLEQSGRATLRGPAALGTGSAALVDAP